MTNTKQGNGPWQVVVLDGDTYIQYGDGTKKNSGKALLARVHDTGDCAINALLIASAPEMLSALKDAKRQIEMMIERMPLANIAMSDSERVSALANVIDKAEGRA